MSCTICPSMNFYFVLTFNIPTRLLQKAKLERAPGTTGSYFPLAQTHGRARVASENPAVGVESRFWQLVQGELCNYQFVFCLPMEMCVFTYTTGFILTQVWFIIISVGPKFSESAQHLLWSYYKGSTL